MHVIHLINKYIHIHVHCVQVNLYEMCTGEYMTSSLINNLIDCYVLYLILITTLGNPRLTCN